MSRQSLITTQYSLNPISRLRLVAMVTTKWRATGFPRFPRVPATRHIDPFKNLFRKYEM